jgi:superoxide reductase
MTEEHYISWVYIETKKGGQRKELLPGNKPYVEFALTEDDTLESAYAYCNLHGLWKSNV